MCVYKKHHESTKQHLKEFTKTYKFFSKQYI